LLAELSQELKLERRGDPLSLLREIKAAIYESFDYKPQSTSVDSPIDDALRMRVGVCQDFAHIMIALARELKIPCRYVSGYLFHEDNGYDRSASGATHAWAEAYLPELGWVGFDPTNNLIVGERHIRTAVGRDYADVPQRVARLVHRRHHAFQQYAL
jgi:transglutaminase-like putative cysteine protease